MYYACGASGYGAAGNSRSCVEVWLADACNITQDIGTRFSMLRLFLAQIVSLLVFAATNIALKGILLLAALVSENKVADPLIIRLIIFLQLSIAAMFVCKSFLVSYEKMSRLIFVVVAASVMFNLILTLLPLSFGVIPRLYFWAGIAMAILLVVYYLWCLYWFIRREYIHIKVVGKNANMKDPPINISADSLWSRINVTSSYAKNMAPAVDAEAMFKELGAIIADIQTLGDHAIEKWSASASRTQSEETETKELLPAQKTAFKYVAIFITVVGVVIMVEGGVDKHQRAVTELKAAAESVQSQVDIAKLSIDDKKWIPNLMSKSESEEAAGKAAFANRNYKEARANWDQALADYTNAKAAALALQSAYQNEVQYRIHMKELTKAAIGKDINATNIPPAILAELSSYMEKHAPGEWAQIKDLASKAESFRAAEQGPECQTQWEAACKLFPMVEDKVKADNSSKQ